MTLSDETTNVVKHYAATYANFFSPTYQSVRQYTYNNKDIGQTGWTTVDEQEKIHTHLKLQTDSHVLDIGCGSGGPLIYLAKTIGCQVFGTDISELAISNAKQLATNEGVAGNVNLSVLDGSDRLNFDDEFFDAVLCIDAIVHFDNRQSVFNEWNRVLKKNGTLALVDPCIVSGLLSIEELRVRSSIGQYYFTTHETQIHHLKNSNFTVLATENTTHSNAATIAERWLLAREKHEEELRNIEGNETFDDQQKFFKVCSKITNESRLSRICYYAVKK